MKVLNQVGQIIRPDKRGFFDLEAQQPLSKAEVPALPLQGMDSRLCGESKKVHRSGHSKVEYLRSKSLSVDCIL